MLPAQVRSQIAEAATHFAPPQADDPSTPEPIVSVTPAPAAPPVAAAPAETISKADYERLNQQFRSLTGIHKSIETDRAALRAQVATLSNTVTALKQQVADFQAIAQAPKLVTDADIKEFTPELLDVISRKAQEMLGPQISNLTNTVQALTQRNAQLEQALTGVAASTEKVTAKDFVGEIASLMPDYAIVNDDPRFVDWLQQINPLTGLTYATDFFPARDSKDAARVVRFFRTFAAEHAALPADPAPHPLAKLVSPAPGSNPPPTPQQSTRVWDGKSISEFYKDKAAGRYAANPALAKSLEADLFKAQSEGRVGA